MTEPGSLAALRRRGGSMLSSLSSSLESWCRRFLDLLELPKLLRNHWSLICLNRLDPAWLRASKKVHPDRDLTCDLSSSSFSFSSCPAKGRAGPSLRRSFPCPSCPCAACWLVDLSARRTPWASKREAASDRLSSIFIKFFSPASLVPANGANASGVDWSGDREVPATSRAGEDPPNPRVAPASRSKGGGRPYDSLPGLPELVAQSCAVGTSSICLAIQLFAIRGDTRSPAAAGSFRLEGTLAGALERLGAAAARRPSEGGLTASDGLLEGGLPTPTQVVGRELLECPGPHASGMNPYSSIEGQWTGILGAQMHSPSHHAI